MNTSKTVPLEYTSRLKLLKQVDKFNLALSLIIGFVIAIALVLVKKPVLMSHRHDGQLVHHHALSHCHR